MNNSIHYLKSRNSDFLAGADLEIFELEGKSKILTVKKVEYKENFRVNGRLKQKGIIAYFEEPYAKPLIINTTNTRKIKELTGVIDASKYVGFSLEFHFDVSVRMKVSQTETLKGGIRIKSVNTNGLVAELKDVKTRIKQAANKAELMSIWQELNESDQAIYKDDMTVKFKSL
ncbi:hypothetical protein [Polaribacter sp. IC073]|uniref:hypothetical protein n=1 Tax=Polaribacter sp. IC073 TaxID=2508540 RepID=UPI0011BE16F0|nr:hypothetical protein [Polaribacter sp. IC073]TXD45877.1 hypothetical protein ES045_15750 [Polaribacter sp. IC073]